MTSPDPKLQRMIATIESEQAATRHLTGRGPFAERIMAAMREVPRDRFVPEELRFSAYANGPLPIGHGQTISQPYIVALMTDLLEPKPDQMVLEVGTGSGYQTAILSRLYRQVYSVELISELGEAAAARFRELGYDNIEIRIGNGYRGWPEHAPYDAIMVTAAAPFIPEALEQQLRPGGRMVIPVGQPHGPQQLMRLDKTPEGDTRRTPILQVAFVPLVDRATTET